MATGVSSEDAIRDLLWQGVQQLAMSEDVYKNALNSLEAKKNELVPSSKNPLSQEELNKIFATYQRVIQESIENIKAQYMIGVELKMLFERPIDLLTISDSLTDIQNRLNPLLSQHKVNEAEIKSLEDRIIELIGKKDDIQKMADANKAFVHYKW